MNVTNVFSCILKIQNRLHIFYFDTFSGSSILLSILIRLFEGYFVFYREIHVDVFLPIPGYLTYGWLSDACLTHDVYGY